VLPRPHRVCPGMDDERLPTPAPQVFPHGPTSGPGAEDHGRFWVELLGVLGWAPCGSVADRLGAAPSYPVLIEAQTKPGA